MLNGRNPLLAEELPGPDVQRPTRALPYIPQPLPDEILGGWLGRCLSYNAVTMVSAFIGRPTNYARSNLLRVLSDRPLPTASVLAVIRSVGATYDYCLRELSTVGLEWCFREHIAAPERFARTATRAPAYFVCPACLTEDSEKFGVPYLHRSHQLLGSVVCHRHGSHLLQNCESCGQALAPTDHISLARCTCRCGASVATTMDPPANTSSWLGLARFEAQCLQAAPGALPRMALIAVLKPLLKEKWGTLHIHAPIRATFARIGKTSIPDAERDATVTGRKQIWSATVPELCALCVAAGLGFEDARDRVREMTTTDASKATERYLATSALSESRSHRKPCRFDEAMKSLLSTRMSRADQSVRSRAQVRRTKPYAFWLMRLADPVWLMTNFPWRRIEKLPSIDDDRALLANADIAPSPQVHLLGWPAFEAAVRAYYRDTKWLNARVRESKMKAIESAGQALLAKIESARLQWQEAEGNASRKSRFTFRRCAIQIGISVSRLRHRCHKLQIPTEACEESTGDFISRCIEFGIQECVRLGLTPSPSHVLRLSRVDFHSKGLVRSRIEQWKARQATNCLRS